MKFRTVRTYQDGYTIGCDDSTDLYHCMNGEEQMLKKDKKPAAYKNLTLAEKFMDQQGVQKIVEPPKKTGWTKPDAVIVPSIEEQLAALPETETRRFVACDVAFGFYKEHHGYAIIDRTTGKQSEYSVDTGYRTYNLNYYEKAHAEKGCEILNANPPTEKVEPDMDILNILVEAEEAWEHRFSKPLPEPKAPPAEQEAIFFSGPHNVGTVISDKYGRKYRTVKPSYYLSEKEVADLEDGFDIFDEQSGWHTEAHLIEEESQC